MDSMNYVQVVLPPHECTPMKITQTTTGTAAPVIIYRCEICMNLMAAPNKLEDKS